jgi:asparagine synthase (glutamine-hydrolysing)
VNSALLENPPSTRLVRELFSRPNATSFLNQMFYVDHHLYLPDDILVKVDIASMANSLEVRSPFLDYRLIELSASLPSEMKVDGTSTKRILRQAVADLLPDSVLNRPKVGFGLPIRRWMQQDLYPMACDLLQDNLAHSRELFNLDTVQGMLKQHKAGSADFGYQLWLLLFFELWCREVLEAIPASR